MPPAKKNTRAVPQQRATTRHRTVLLATTGLSPAILTETVWALAQETPPVIPDTVIVLTTVTGRAQLEKQLFGTDAAWDQLRRTLLGKQADSDPRLDFDLTPDRVKVVHQRVGVRNAQAVPVGKLQDSVNSL